MHHETRTPCPTDPTADPTDPAHWLARPTPEEIEAAAARGREPGAVGYNEAGQLVQRQADGSLRVIEDQERPA